MTKCTLCKNDIVLYTELQDSFIQIDHRFYHFECAIKVRNNHKIDNDYLEDSTPTIFPQPKPRYTTNKSTSFWGRVQEKCSTCTRPKDHHTAQQVKECMT